MNRTVVAPIAYVRETDRVELNVAGADATDCQATRFMYPARFAYWPAAGRAYACGYPRGGDQSAHPAARRGVPVASRSCRAFHTPVERLRRRFATCRKSHDGRSDTVLTIISRRR